MIINKLRNNMDDLIELSNVVSKLKSRNIEIIDQGNKESLSYQLYDGICNNKIKNDEDAAQLLYQKEIKKNTLRKLKSRLRNKLLNTVFFIDTNKPNVSDFLSAITYTHKHYSIIRLLIFFGGRKTAIEHGEKIYSIAKKFEMSEMQYLLSQILKSHHALYSNNHKKYKHYLKEFKIAKENLNAEEFALDCILYQQILTQKSKSSFDDIQKHFDEKINELEVFKSKISSFTFNRNYYTFMLRFAEIQPERLSLIQICEEAINYFKSVPFANPAIFFAYDLRILKYCILNKDRVKGENIFFTYDGKFQHLPNTQSALFYYYIILNLHVKTYNNAFQILYTAITDSNFRKLSIANRKSFTLIESYVHFLLNTGKIDPSQTDFDTSKIKKFKINKFLNDIPTHSKLKTGGNIALLIIHVLFLLQMKKQNDIIDRVDALNQYCYRYLRNDETYRYNCFIKMLIQMTKANFNRIRTIRYTSSLRNKLISMPLEQSSISLDTEIIPFEDLWEMVLELLD